MTEQEKCQIEATCTKQAANDDCCCDMPEKLLAMADEAWFELLKEKIKVEISKSCGNDMEKLAKLVAEANKEKWAHTVQGKIKCDEYKENIKAIFSQAAKAQCNPL